jgi:hypothetical protein
MPGTGQQFDREKTMKLTASFECFEEGVKLSRKRAQQLARGEDIPPSRRINLGRPLPLNPELLHLLDIELREKDPKDFTSRDLDLIIKMSRAERKLDEAAKAERAKKRKKKGIVEANLKG